MSMMPGTGGKDKKTAGISLGTSTVVWQHINFYGRYKFTNFSEQIDVEAIFQELAWLLSGPFLSQTLCFYRSCESPPLWFYRIRLSKFPQPGSASRFLQVELIFAIDIDVLEASWPDVHKGSGVNYVPFPLHLL
jgi:hypothetical protein